MIGKGRIHLLEVVAVRVGDGEGHRLPFGKEGLPAVIDVVTETALHVAVLGIVIFVLETGHEVVDASGPAELVRHHDGMHVAEVAIGERIRTERGEDGLVRLTLLVHIVLQDVHGREVATHEAARLILVRPGGTEHIGGLAVEKTGIELGGDGGEVLLLVVAAGLEELRIGRRTAVVVPVVRIRVDRVHGARRGVRVERMGVADPEVQLVVGIDNPVQAAHDLIVRGAQGIALVTAGIVTVLGLECRKDIFHEGLGRTDDVGIRNEIRVHPAGSGAHDLVGTGHGVGRVLGVDEEEDFVLDDGTAHGETDGVVQERRPVQVFTLNFITTDLVRSIVVVGGSMELVRTALRDGVDRAAGKAGVTDIERSDVHAHLLDGVEGDRAAAGRQVGTDTEGVVERGAVDRDIGGTVVTTTDGQTVGGRRSLRSELHHVVHAAVDGREGLHRTLADGSAGTGTLDVHSGIVAVGDEDRGVQTQRFILEGAVDDDVLSEWSIHVLVLDLPVSQEFDVDRVRTAGRDAADAIVTVLVGDSIVSGTGRPIGGDDSSTGHRTVLVRDAAADDSGRHLGKGDSARHQHGDNEQKAFESVLHK